MDRELTFSQMEMCTLESIKKVNQMVKVNISGEMVQSILANSKMDSSMAKVNGKVGKVPNVISMRGIIQMIRSMDLAFSNGLVVTCTKESIRMMKEMGMVK